MLGSYTPVSVPHSLFKLTNMKVSKPTNMNLNQTHEHECCNTAEHYAWLVTQPPMYFMLNKLLTYLLN